MELRPYQVQAIDALRQRFTAGAKRIVLCAPTGAGKTCMFCEIIRSAVSRGRRALVLVHRRELVDQTMDKLSSIGIEAGVIMAADRRRDDYLPVQVASIQTLARRMGKLPPADVVVYDEAHHATSDSSRRILNAYPEAIVIGASATPWRTDRVGLSDLFEGSVLAATPAELIEQGHLVPYEAFAWDAPELHAVKITAGDYNQKDLGLACNTDVLVGSAVKGYLEHTRGRRAIVFAVDIKHSQHMVEEFRAAGVPAAHVDCSTPTVARKRSIDAFTAGELLVLSSVGIFSEGWDCPSAEVAILCRPTKSLSLHLQCIGRVLRTHPGKAKATIQCHSGNLLRHGLPDDERSYELTATPERVKALHTCPYCSMVFGKARPDGTCPHCGARIAPLCLLCVRSPCVCPQAVRARQEKITLPTGERLSIDEIRARRSAAGIRDLPDGALLKAATATRREQASEYLRLCCLAESRGFKPAFVSMAYRECFGEFPRFTDAELEGVAPARFPIVPLPPRRAA